VSFVFASMNVQYYIYRFVYIELPLHLWEEADLVLVDDLSDVLLDLVFHYFIEDFCIYFFKEIGLQFSFVEVSFSGIGMRAILASLNELDSVPSLSILWNSLRMVCISYSLNV
jgi:hypothetical protein